MMIIPKLYINIGRRKEGLDGVENFSLNKNRAIEETKKRVTVVECGIQPNLISLRFPKINCTKYAAFLQLVLDGYGRIKSAV